MRNSFSLFFRSAALAATLSVTGALATPDLSHAHGMVYADLVERVSPAVVNIFTTRAAPQMSGPGENPFPEGHPMRRFFERFGAPGSQRRFGDLGPEPREALGSGFIFDADGYVITNHHVVDGADSIRIKLSDEREFDARLIGSDEMTDIALLKIDAVAPLPYVSLGPSQGLRVGEEVLAVGNPFGLGGTVTRGIVSAKGRDIEIGGPYVDYIQTDAAINRGNSGGPLFDMNGNVVGVNTAIFSPSGGSVGVGFAVPSRIVSRIVDDLRIDGEVQRGWLGVAIQPVTDAIAEALGLPAPTGTIVADVDPDGPSSGVLRSGDVILSFNDRTVSKSRDLPRFVASAPSGSVVPVTVLRDGIEQTLSVQLGELPDRRAAVVPAAAPTATGAEEAEAARLGARLASVTPRLRNRFGLEPSESGAVIVDLEPEGAARKSGLQRGDVILRIGDTTITDPADVASALDAASGDASLFLIRRDGRDIYVGVSLSSA